MKSVAIIALLGLISVTQVEQAQAVARSFPGVTFIQQGVQGESSDDSDSSDDDQTDVQTSAWGNDDEEKVDHSGEVFEAREIGTGPLDKKYERVPPEQFTAGGDDLFMRSMIMTYAQEHKNVDGTPNGVFGMTEAATKAASSEVLGSHKGLKAKELSEYMSTYFKRTWDHYDVTKSGELGVETMPAFMRFLSSDQTLNL